MNSKYYEDEFLDSYESSFQKISHKTKTIKRDKKAAIKQKRRERQKQVESVNLWDG